ncbi:MAG: polymer-forming cytoskeletal protein [Deltaproteobacteria bacterium]|nr:polymer-forming cytoskeletal protein [Deltaproteobacteria bacterium]
MNRRIGRFARIAPFLLLAVSLPVTALGSVRKDGAWPAQDKKVSFEFEGNPSEGISKLASEAGWSLVVSKGIAVSEHDVKIDVDDQPADAVLDALFAESKVIAKRNGSLVTITPDDGRSLDGLVPPAPLTPPAPLAPPTPPTPPAAAAPAGAAQPASIAAPPVPTVRGEDRNVVGDSVVIGKDEIVHTVTVTGGSAKILGTVTGDLVVAGGSAKIESGARVVGNATVFGGSLKVESGARVDGDVGIVGGALKREDGAIIGGKVVDSGKGDHGNVKVSVHDGDVSASVEESKHPTRSRIGQAAHDFGQSITRMALLFVLGCVLLALATNKMESLRLEAAARPMRSFAMGIVGTLAAVTAIAVACITIIGIPFAAMAVLLGVFALYSAIAAVLTTVGAAMLQHRTKNPYAHLLAGCAAFLVGSSIPWVGGLLTFAVAMIAAGTLVSTRLGGIAGRPRKPELV